MTLPWPTAIDQLRLVEPVHSLGQGVVVRVAAAADRGGDAGRRQPFAVADREVLGVFNRSTQQHHDEWVLDGENGPTGHVG